MVVPIRLPVVLPVVPLLRLGIPLLRGILLLWEILLETFFQVGRLEEVEWVAALAVVPVLHLVGQLYRVQWLFSLPPRHLRY